MSMKEIKATSLEFGPWTTSLGPARLSTFWRRRMHRLASAGSARPELTRRDWLRLGCAGGAVAAVPSLRFAHALEDATKVPDTSGLKGRIYANLQLAGPDRDDPYQDPTVGL